MKFPSARAAAQFYLFEYGWSVMPTGRLTDRGEPKAPYLGAGEIIPLRTQALDVDGITALWGAFPEAGVSVLTGKLSNLTVIDVDFDKKINGVPAPDAQLAYHADIPTNTLMARSGSGGLHFFFKHSPKADGRKELRPHIDLKSEGGYIILPPSRHKSGREYEWLNDLPIADFPEHLLEKRQEVHSMKSGERVRSYWDKLVNGLAEGEGGGRNNYIASVAGMCFKNDISVEDAILYLVPFGQSCKPPVDLETIERTVRSAYKTALSKQPKPADESKIEVVDLWQAADEVAAEVGEKKYPLGLYGWPGRPLDARGTTPQALSDATLISADNDPLKSKIEPNTVSDVKSVFDVGEMDPISEALNGGMVLGDLGVISGHTGRGKTLLAQIITQGLIARGERALWFEFELMPPEMRERFKVLGVDKGTVFVPRDVETKNLDGSMEFVEAAIIKAKEQVGARFVFLDLLDRFRPRNDKERKAVNTNLSSYLGLIAEQLKDLAMKHKVVIVLMAHTRKPPPGASKQAPDLHDINNSGGVAQNADWVIMVHRYSYKELGGMSPEQKAVAVAAKESLDEESLSDISKVTLHKNRRTGKYAAIEIRYTNGVITHTEGSITTKKSETKQEENARITKAFNAF